MNLISTSFYHLRSMRCVYCQQRFDTGGKGRAVIRYYCCIAHTDEFEIPSQVIAISSTESIRFSHIERIRWCDICQFSERMYTCKKCFSREQYVAHKECLDGHEILLSRKVTYTEICDIGNATKPWFAMPTEDKALKTSKRELEILLHKLNDSDTKKLIARLVASPEELFGAIMWEMADRSPLARISSVLQYDVDLVRQLLTDKEHSVGFQFLGILYPPIFKSAKPTTDKSVIRYGVDHLGIRTTEILDDYPDTSRPQFGECPWYVVVSLQFATKNFRIVSKGPFLRLVSKEYEQVLMWNLINPPKEGSWQSAGVATEFPIRRNCIDMRNVTGLTFFLGGGSILSIHGHSGNDTAISTYRSLKQKIVHQAVWWIYFPLQPQETITKAWARTRGTYKDGIILAIQTSRNRFRSIGYVYHDVPSSYEVFCDTPMTHLLYEEPIGHGIQWFGAIPKLFSSPQRDLEAEESYGTNFSSASLMNVVQADVYGDGDQNATTGVLFTYSDGSCECIGQRCVGLSTTTIRQIHLPTRIHYRTFVVEEYKTRVEIQFSCGSTEQLSEPWHSQDMVGTITWMIEVLGSRRFRDAVKLSV